MVEEQLAGFPDLKALRALTQDDSCESFLLGNLQLLQFNFVQQSAALKTQIQAGCFAKDNPKVFFTLLHFLLAQLAQEDDMKAFLGYFPVQTQQDGIEFKRLSLELLALLEKRGKVPRNFVLGKSLLDQFKGPRLL